MMADLVRLLVMLVLSVSLSEVTADDECPPPWVVMGQGCMRVHRALGHPDQRWIQFSWKEARRQCQQLAPGQADLSVLADSHTLADLSLHINKTFPHDFPVWLGGEKIIEHGHTHWQWLNGIKIDVTSHLWLPSQPSVDKKTGYTLLVPADGTHGRYYMVASDEGGTAPAAVCQLGKKKDGIAATTTTRV